MGRKARVQEEAPVPRMIPALQREGVRLPCVCVYAWHVPGRNVTTVRARDEMDILSRRTLVAETISAVKTYPRLIDPITAFIAFGTIH